MRCGCTLGLFQTGSSLWPCRQHASSCLIGGRHTKGRHLGAWVKTCIACTICRVREVQGLPEQHLPARPVLRALCEPCAWSAQ